jgi:hypothetical protein
MYIDHVGQFEVALGYLRITYYTWKHCEAVFDGSTAGTMYLVNRDP